MARENTGFSPTEMIQFQVVWNRPNETFVSITMSLFRSFSRWTKEAISELATGEPNPALSRSEVDLCPEAGMDGTFKLHRKYPFGVMQPGVPRAAAALIVS